MTTWDVDLDVLRRDTPGTSERVHLNNAGAGLMPAPVIDAIQGHIELEARVGGYEAADLVRDRVGEAYMRLAALLSTGPDQIAITENATASFQQALSSIPFRPGDRIVTTRNDYASNQIQYLSLARRFGIEVVRAPDHKAGGVDVRALAGLVHRLRPRLVAMSHVPTNSGLVQDAAEVGRICRERSTWFLLDACQSLGQIPLDPEAMGCDFLTATARKFLRGPRGIGILWTSARALDGGLEPLFPDLRGADWIGEDLYQPAPDATRFENWEFAYALVLGLGAAADYALRVGVERGGSRAAGLAARLREGLRRAPGIRVLDRGRQLCAIVTAQVVGHDPAALVGILRSRGINTSALDRSSAVLDFDDKDVEGALRISPHYYNTEREVDLVTETLSEIASEAPE
jgi:selenocysteine lyase/cysteine desulfurase